MHDLNFLYNLDDVFILQNMVLPYPLRPMLARNTPNQGVFEVFHDRFMDAVAEILNSTLVLLQNHWITEIRKLAFWLGVNPEA